MLRWLFYGFLTTIVLAVLSNLIARFATMRRKGQTVRRLSAPGVLLWTVLFLGFGISIVIWLSSYVRDVSSLLAFVLCALYIVIVVVLAAFLLFHHVFWTEEGIGSWDPWQKSRFVRWSEARRIAHYPLIGLRSVSDGRSRVFYSPWFDGAAELDRFVSARRIGEPS